MKQAVAISFKIPATLSAIDELCIRARSWLLDNGLQKDWFAVAMLLRESLNNAVVHGSQNNPLLCVNCELRCGYTWLSISVEDCGGGFNWACLRKHRAHCEDICGRGLQMYKIYADEVVFNRLGNRVLLRRRVNEGGRSVVSAN